MIENENVLNENEMEKVKKIKELLKRDKQKKEKEGGVISKRDSEATEKLTESQYKRVTLILGAAVFFGFIGLVLGFAVGPLWGLFALGSLPFIGWDIIKIIGLQQKKGMHGCKVEYQDQLKKNLETINTPTIDGKENTIKINLDDLELPYVQDGHDKVPWEQSPCKNFISFNANEGTIKIVKKESSKVLKELVEILGIDEKEFDDKGGKYEEYTINPEDSAILLSVLKDVVKEKSLSTSAKNIIKTLVESNQNKQKEEKNNKKINELNLNNNKKQERKEENKEEDKSSQKKESEKEKNIDIYNDKEKEEKNNKKSELNNKSDDKNNNKDI